MTRIQATGVLAAIVLGAAGCGSQQVPATQDSASPTSASTPSTTSASTSGQQQASAAQYASLVAAESSQTRELIQTLGDTSRCDLTGAGPVDVESGSIVCSAGISTLGYSAEIIASKLTGAMKPGVPAYIGAPPGEISALVDETIQAAEKVGGAAEDASDCGLLDAPPQGCAEKLTTLRMAIPDLSSQLDAWSPYGVN